MSLKSSVGQPPTQRMAEKLMKASGASYRTADEMFRFYVRGLDLDTFKSEIDRVTNPDIFRVLWSVGMSDEKQDGASRKWKQP